MLTLSAGALAPHDITVLLLSLAVMLGLARLLGEIAHKLRQPSILGEILAGILLGPTLFGAVNPELYAWLFPSSGAANIALEGFITLAVTLLLLVAGLEVDLSTVVRQGRAAISVSVTGIVFPFTIGMVFAYLLPELLGKDPGAPTLTFALFIGIALSITALPVIAKTLMDLNIFKSDLGMMIISAAMVDDLLGWMGFAMVLAMMQGHEAAGNGSSGVMLTVMLTLVYLVMMLTIGRAVVHRALPFIQAHTSWPGGVLGFVLTLSLLGAAFTEAIGIHAIFGAFIAGVAIGDSRHLRERTRDTIHQFVTHIFAPVFFASIGLRISFIAEFDLLLVIVVLLIAIATKVLGCYAGAKWAGLGKRESLAIGFGMAGRGAMEIILAQLAFHSGLITGKLFVAIVVMALVTSLLSGPVMQKLLRRAHKLRLKELLTERHIVMNVAAGTAQQAIVQLAKVAANVTGVDEATIADAVWNREQIMHTGLPNGLAVPHARLADLKNPTVILGLSAIGTDFDAPDGERTRVICMLLTPADDPGSQLELLAMIAQLFSETDTRDRIIHAQSATEVLAAIRLADPNVEHV